MLLLKLFNKKSDFEKLKFVNSLFLAVIVAPLYKTKTGIFEISLN